MTQARLLGGRYQVGELLGYGGMAEVHRGRDLRLGRDFAIKMLRSVLARDDRFQLLVRREAQNASSLNHPAIVAVYDTGEERGSSGESLPYIVMEFVNGRTLKEVLAVEGRLAPRRALEITAEICAALEFSHRHGIIHRDIKPGNVMLTQTGQIKVMDFGIARALANSGSTMTQTSAVIGTAQYLSPEQARGEPVDARSDVYATGCVLYELIAGQPPFVGDSPVSVAYQHVREDAKPPSLINRDVPPPVDAVVLKALAKNPLNRYQSAAEMRADMLRAASGRPVYAEPVLLEADPAATRTLRATQTPGRPGSGRPGQRRRTSGWMVAGLAALAVLAVVTLVAGLIVASSGSVTVPNLVGQDRSQAMILLTNAGLEAAPVDKESPTCQPNKVLTQDPEAGARVDEGTRISFEWCAGAGVVTIPSVANLPEAVAISELEDLGLKVTVEPADSSLPQGTAIETDPPVGQEVAADSTIILKVSKGNLKKVPNVVGRTEAEAKAVLETTGFLPGNIEVLETPTDDADRAGRVMFQDPVADSERDPATTTIRITIGKYTEPEPTGTPTPTPTPTP